MTEYNAAVVKSLSTNPLDLPFALWYTVDRSSSQDPSLAHFILSGSIGVPPSHPSAPDKFSLSSSGSSSSHSGSTVGMRSSPSIGTTGSGGQDPSAYTSSSRSLLRELRSASVTAGTMFEPGTCPWAVQEAVESRSPVRMACEHLTVGMEKRAWDECASEALILPIVDIHDPASPILAVLVVGLNPRRPLDAHYENWLRLLGGQLHSGLIGIAAFESSMRQAAEVSLAPSHAPLALGRTRALNLRASPSLPAQLAQLDKAKTAFFQNAAHELKSPTTLLSGPIADLLELEKTDSPRRRLLEISNRNATRLKRLVDSLMDFSKVRLSFEPWRYGFVR